MPLKVTPQNMKSIKSCQRKKFSKIKKKKWKKKTAFNDKGTRKDLKENFFLKIHNSKGVFMGDNNIELADKIIYWFDKILFTCLKI